MFGIFLGVKSLSLFRSTVFSRRLHYSRYFSSQIGEIMKLYSDRGNPVLLRILAAKNLAGVPLTVQYINYEDKNKFHCPGSSKLPVLETDSGSLLNSPNSICRYLLELGRKSSEVPDPNKEAVINQWVEWESTSLQPVLFSHLVLSIGLGRQDSGHVEDVRNLLRHADGELSSHMFFSGV
ncbi:methionine--tRNA ligase, cytoplasmic-like [Orbicella faveolata]|uniref:methionine--tRNA ligase, cytoplasmic-like n=1 Tax=Orbicella faveolata TaxID=48498 RepID=UPI0009E3B9DC|nr:methionine--tRNA ligase, cytoplasmic-like [Orbicella faveolata]